MKLVTDREAQTNLDALIDAAQAGEGVEITRGGQVVARLLPVANQNPAIDMDSLMRFRSTLTSPVANTEEELRAWKDESPC